MERLGAGHLIALAVGIDPYSDQPPTPTQSAKQKMLRGHLHEAYLRAAGWAFEAAQRVAADEKELQAIRSRPIPLNIPVDGHSPVPGKWASLSAHAGKIGLLPTEELTMAFEGAFWHGYIHETLERLHSFGEDMPDDAMFERDAIHQWLTFLGWQSAYDFAPWRNEIVANVGSETGGEPPHPRSEKHYVALIAAMAINGYGYDPSAKQSPIPKELADLLTNEFGYALSDESIRGYLRVGAGHLYPKTPNKANSL